MSTRRVRVVLARLGAVLLGAVTIAVFSGAGPAYAAEDMTLLVPSKIDLGDATPGGSAAVPIRLHATGDQPVDGLTVIFGGYRVGVDLRGYGDCTYYHAPLADGATELRGAVCYVLGTLTPGSDYEVLAPGGGPVRFDVARDAPGPWTMISAFEVRPGHAEPPWQLEGDARKGMITRTTGTGDPLRLRQGGSDGPGADWREWTTSFSMRTTANPYDMQALGATASGRVGDTVKVTVGAKNHGPASEYRDDNDAAVWVRVAIPPGAKVVEVPRYCAPADEDWHYYVDEPERLGQPRYVCNFDSIRAGARRLFTFRLQITEVIVDATGSVSLDLSEDTDTNAANNQAEIVINPGGSPGAGDGEHGGNSTGESGGGLPVTGLNVWRLTLVAGVVLALGTLLLVIGRRRRA